MINQGGNVTFISKLNLKVMMKPCKMSIGYFSSKMSLINLKKKVWELVPRLKGHSIIETK
jgi:hypothetical protein